MARLLLSVATLLLFFSIATAGRLFTEIQPNFTASNFRFVDNNGAFLSSPNDTFRVALYNPLSQQSRFYFCVLHLISNVIVWAGNRDSSVTNTGTFSLSPAGILVSHVNGSIAWSTPPLRASVAAVRLGDNGNLVLFDANNRSLWESFDHPTDTIVLGQRLQVGNPVFGSVAASDLATGMFSLSLTQSDAYLQWKSELSYWSLSTDVRAFKFLNAEVSFMELNSSGLFFYDGVRNVVVWHLASSSPAGFRVAVVAADGRFVIRSYDGRDWNEDFAAPDDNCRLPLSCGPLGLCSASGCVCPSGFHASAESPTAGCSPVDGSKLASPKCDGGGFGTSVSYIRLGTGSQYFAGDYQSQVAAVSTFGACQILCSRNCSCLGFFFQNSSSSCYLLKDELGSLFYSTTEDADRLGYVKVIRNPDVTNDDNKSKKNFPTALLILLPCIGAGLLIVLMTTLFLWWRRLKDAKTRTVKLGRPNSSSSETDCIDIPGMPERYKYEVLEAATDDFSTQIGVGGFGAVYKGTLPDKSLVAVKKITNVGVQGKKEFLTEIAIIGGIRHVNLVRLRGFCARGTERLLVYEYMNRGSLDRTLFGSGPVLEWQERVDIALGTARGLAYLHGGCEHKIIHCDIKPENILLHDRFQVKISDFGLSKLMSPEQSNLFTTMRGTRGYLAPEWLTNAAISDKTDVYSYGMVLLELISGRKNCSPRGTSGSTDNGSDEGSVSTGYFPLQALEMHEQRRYTELADPRVEGRVMSEEVAKLVRVALCCAHEDPGLRPTMATVVAMLEGSAPVGEPRVQSLNFLRFYGRRFSESVGAEGVDENRVLYQGLTTGSSNSSTSGTQTSVGVSYLSSQQISGPR
ncbi:G-type lectin S-receptor-like serine/threonine-protein kinase At5g35370 [Aristolochia californica]|uniref:G-type lectin S-receptor-like serine/threonine-protein kinase At5g35370 n=1 Tax=Aristolochia californica TaxID=171875 RepID=UPI0035D90477